jgi:hypothetical protein
MRHSPVLGFLVAACLAAFADPVPYELIAGSKIIDDCRDCDRIPIERPLAGTFSFEFIESIPGATSYALTDIDLSDAAKDYVVKGEGVYREIVTATPLHAMELKLEINGVDGVALSTEAVPNDASWPILDIAVTESGDRDPAHLYTIRIVAAPQPRSWQTYVLEEGTVLRNQCPSCTRDGSPAQLKGQFLLGEIDSGANPFVTYLVKDFQAMSSAPDVVYEVRGGGYYRQGGEVALVQEMRLSLEINDMADIALAVSPEPLRVAWPAIDIDLKHQNPVSDLYLFYLTLVARPAAAEDAFLRGDGNADGQRNIADAVHTLGFLFGGGPAPTCLDAADANDDGELNIADAVAVLSYLFGGTGPLPPPFDACGPDPTADAKTCADFPPCP